MKDDPVDHPSHYTRGSIECADAIESAGYGMGFYRGSAIKYLWRAGKKQAADECEDLRKAAWYVTREIERMQRAHRAAAAEKSDNELLRAALEKELERR